MTQIQGPGAPPATMSTGPVEPHDEPQTIGGQTDREDDTPAAYVVQVGQLAVGDGGESVVALLEVVYDGPDMNAANVAYAEASAPDGGFVQLLENGEMMIEKLSAVAPVEPPAEPEVGGQASAFDTDRFTPKRPQVQDEDVDKIQIAFTGVWELDPMIEEDVEFWNRLHFGQSLDMKVEAEIVDIAGKYKRNENDGETITGVAKAKIIHARRLTPEEL